MASIFSLELKKIRTITHAGTNIRTVKFELAEGSDFEGKNYQLKIMDEMDPRFLYHSKITPSKFQTIQIELELNFEFEKFSDYLQDLLRSVPDSEHRLCEMNAENVPHLIIKDRSDMWKTNTLLKLPLQDAQDDDLLCHMVELCTERKKFIDELTYENRNLTEKMEHVIEKNNNLSSEIDQAQRQYEHNMGVIKHESALEKSELKRNHEVYQRKMLEDHRLKQEKMTQNVSNLKENLSETDKKLEETLNLKLKLEKKVEEIEDENVQKEKKNLELFNEKESLSIQLTKHSTSIKVLEQQTEKLDFEKKELLKFKEQGRLVENELTNDKMRLQHANECFLRETNQLKQEFERLKECERLANQRVEEIERIQKKNTHLTEDVNDLRRKYEENQQLLKESEIQFMKMKTEFEFINKEKDKLKIDYEKQQKTFDELIKNQPSHTIQNFPLPNTLLPPSPHLFSSSLALDNFGSEKSYNINYEHKYAMPSSNHKLNSIPKGTTLTNFDYLNYHQPKSTSSLNNHHTNHQFNTGIGENLKFETNTQNNRFETEDFEPQNYSWMKEFGC